MTRADGIERARVALVNTRAGLRLDNEVRRALDVAILAAELARDLARAESRD